MIKNVESPRTELTDEEIEEFPIPDIEGSFIFGLTKRGDHPVVKEGSKWQLVDENGELYGDGFQKINQFSVVDGDVYYLVKFGGTLQIANSDGVKITRNYHSLEYIGQIDGTRYYLGKLGATNYILTETSRESLSQNELSKVLEQKSDITVEQ